MKTMINIRTPNYEGTVRRLDQLPEVSTVERLSSLVEGGQIRASADGMSVAIVYVSDNGAECVNHSDVDLPLMTFRRANIRDGGLIVIEVTEQNVMIWGRPINGHPSGVYRLHKDGADLLAPMWRVLEIHRNSQTYAIVGRQRESDGHRIILTSSGLLRLTQDAFVLPMDRGRVQIVEQIGRMHYRYVIDPTNGFVDFHPAPVQNSERMLAMVHYRGLKILCLSGASQSRLVALGSSRRVFGADGQIVMRGNLERVWQSPDGVSIAWLTRCVEHGRVVRELVLNGETIYRGSFELFDEDLKWSPSQEHVGAIVHPLSGGIDPQLVTRGSAITISCGEVVDFVVDDNGCMAAYLLRESGSYTPVVYGQHRSPVPYAWNLGVSAQGISYNSVRETSVLLNVDVGSSGR